MWGGGAQQVGYPQSGLVPHPRLLAGMWPHTIRYRTLRWPGPVSPNLS